MSPFKPGLGMMVAGTNAPVIPCHIAGAHDAWPPDRHPPAGAARAGAPPPAAGRPGDPSI